MKLDGVKLISETDREFRVSHPEHGEMRIAKEHLHHGTVQKIKQHFADGGEVQDNPFFQDSDESVGAIKAGLKGALSGIFPTETPYQTAQREAAAAPPTTQAPPSAQDAPAVPIAQPTPAPAAAAQPAPMPGVGGEFNSGLKQELGGIQAQGEAAQSQAAAESKAYEQRQQGLQKMQADMEGQMAAHTARVEKLQTDILNGKIDPNRFWNTRTTGQKITAALGMILGGAGAGVTGQPNYAIQAIDKAIDRDLESQKLEMGKKETLLGYYMQQGHQLMAAHQLAKADYMDITSAQLMKAASQGGGQKAAAVAQQLAGAAKMGADQMRRQATLQGLQIQQTKMSTDFQRAQLGAMQGLFRGGGEGGSNLDPAAEAMLPEEMRARIVRLSDGKATLARTAKDADEVKKTDESTTILSEKLKRYNTLLQTGSPVLSPSDRATAHALHESILTDINGLAGLNRFTSEEAKIFAGRVPDITNMIKPGAKAKLDELGTEIADKVWATNRTRLSLKRGPSPTELKARGKNAGG